MSLSLSSDKKKRILFLYLFLLIIISIFYDILIPDHFIGYIDGKLYYDYLPEWFINHNFSFYVKFPIGTALMECPFFFAAHLLTLLINKEGSGYGGFYEYGVAAAALFYFVIALILIFKTLNKLKLESGLFSIIFLTAGTFLPYYATKYASFSHIYTFFFSSLFMFLSVKIREEYEEEGKQNAFIHFLLGASAGFLFLIRNINVLFIIFYVFIDLFPGRDGIKKYRKHLKYILKVKNLLFNFLGAIIIILPQLFYWKKNTGSFILNTYSDESFSFLLNPKISEVLFSDAKGIFILSPILIFSMLGFITGLGKGKPERKYILSSLFIFLFEIYVTAAWWCWWLGGVYGIRAIIDIMPYLAIPFSSFLDYMLYEKADGKGKINALIKALFIFISIIFIYANLSFLRASVKGELNETFTNWYELKRAFFNLY